MRTSLDHLPAHKQRELERVVQIIFEEFEDGIALATKDWKKRGRIDKVILYGSYARGGWVDEPHTSKGYRSDYDLMIIVTDQRLVEMAEVWAKLDERLMREYDITQTIKTPVNFIVHTISDVNDGLAHGRYFFMDIALDGIALYQREDSDFYKPRPKSSTQALEMAQEYFDDWFPSSMRKFKLAKDAREQDFPKESAFLLHQSVESLYHGILLVKTFYTPHVHKLAFLRTQAERLDMRLVDAWPRETRLERAYFQKLKDAYVKGRYSKHYEITHEEIDWLIERVEVLGQAVLEVCTEHLAKLTAEANLLH
jgi:predicted nucleotidyltransferase/HEPN domain-containing protein